MLHRCNLQNLFILCILFSITLNNKLLGKTLFIGIIFGQRMQKPAFEKNSMLAHLNVVVFSICLFHRLICRTSNVCHRLEHNVVQTIFNVSTVITSTLTWAPGGGCKGVHLHPPGKLKLIWVFRHFQQNDYRKV